MTPDRLQQLKEQVDPYSSEGTLMAIHELLTEIERLQSLLTTSEQMGYVKGIEAAAGKIKDCITTDQLVVIANSQGLDTVQFIGAAIGEATKAIRSLLPTHAQSKEGKE